MPIPRKMILQTSCGFRAQFSSAVDPWCTAPRDRRNPARVLPTPRRGNGGGTRDVRARLSNSCVHQGADADSPAWLNAEFAQCIQECGAAGIGLFWAAGMDERVRRSRASGAKTPEHPFRVAQGGQHVAQPSVEIRSRRKGEGQALEMFLELDPFAVLAAVASRPSLDLEDEVSTVIDHDAGDQDASRLQSGDIEIEPALLVGCERFLLLGVEPSQPDEFEISIVTKPVCEGVPVHRLNAGRILRMEGLHRIPHLLHDPGGRDDGASIDLRHADAFTAAAGIAGREDGWIVCEHRTSSGPAPRSFGLDGFDWSRGADHLNIRLANLCGFGVVVGLQRAGEIGQVHALQGSAHRCTFDRLHPEGRVYRAAGDGADHDHLRSARVGASVDSEGEKGRAPVDPLACDAKRRAIMEPWPDLQKCVGTAPVGAFDLAVNRFARKARRVLALQMSEEDRVRDSQPRRHYLKPGYIGVRFVAGTEHSALDLGPGVGGQNAPDFG